MTTEKVAVVAPATTVTVDGTVAMVLLDARFTTKPPVGAADESVTVPVEEIPPCTDVGPRVSPATVISPTFNVALALTPPEVPVIIAVVIAPAIVVIGNVPVFEPPSTVT